MERYRARLEKVYDDNPHKPIYNLTLIKQFLRKVKNEKRSLATQRTDCAGFIVFSTFCNVPFESLTEEDIYDFFDYLDEYVYSRGGKNKKYSESSQYTHKAVLRKLLKFIGNNKLAESIKCRNPSSNKLPEDLLTREEIDRMLNATLTPRDSAILATLYESGARKGELSSVRLKNVTFDINGCVVTLPAGKTGARRIRLVFASSFLQTWINCHPTKEDPESFLFVSLRSPFPKLSNAGLYNQLQRLAERAGVTKRVNPHSWRHMRATELAMVLSDQTLKAYLGWTAGSSQAQTYVHLSGRDIDTAILKIHGIETPYNKSNKLNTCRCQRCKEIQDDKNVYCFKCGYPLHDDGVKILEKESDEFEMMFLKLTAEYPELLNKLDKYTKNE